MNKVQIYGAVFVIGFTLSLILQPDVLFALMHDDEADGDNIKFTTRSAHAAIAAVGILAIAAVADYYLKRAPMTISSRGGNAAFGGVA